MAATDTDAALYDAQESSNPGNAPGLQVDVGTGYAVGKLTAIYSHMPSATAGAVGDTISFCRLPAGTIIVGGWLYFENAIGADDGDLADLGVVYEAGDGTDDVDCLADGLGLFDGADTFTLGQNALPLGSIYHLGHTTAAFPYTVTGGIGTVQLLTLTDALVTAKDVKLVLYVILPGF